jgi:hypothetical protein
LFGTQLSDRRRSGAQHLRGVTAAWNFPSGSILALMPQDVSIPLSGYASTFTPCQKAM